MKASSLATGHFIRSVERRRRERSDLTRAFCRVPACNHSLHEPKGVRTTVWFAGAGCAKLSLPKATYHNKHHRDDVNIVR